MVEESHLSERIAVTAYAKRSRRDALKLMAGAATSLAYSRSVERGIARAANPSVVTDAARTSRVRTSAILHTGEWAVGSFPNYCDTAIVNGRHYVWTAVFASSRLSRVDTETGDTLEMPTGPDALPLDVAYDARRNRLVVASADSSALMIVLDAGGHVVERKELAPLTGQGASKGGAQGVVVDREGNYWFALSYYDDRADGQGVLVKIDGSTFALLRIIKNVGMENPNGLLFWDKDDLIVALSENGLAHCFDLDGHLQRTLPTVNVGYRGTISYGELWVAGWTENGGLSRTSLRTGDRSVFPCVSFANSVAVDDARRIWVAGDAGISVSTGSGSIITTLATDRPTNGLTSMNGRTFHVTHEHEGRLMEVALVQAQLHLPTVSRSADKTE